MTCSQCERPVLCKQQCRFHYDQHRRHEQASRLCSQDRCRHKVFKASLCRLHFKRVQKKQPHCTYGTCIKKQFYRMKCQYHFQNMSSFCQHCHQKGTYCKQLCRTCYDQGYLSEPLEPCTMCSRHVYMYGYCVVHFRQFFIHHQCVVCPRPSVHMGYCKKHCITTLRDTVSI